jgi:hypothetical protein
MVHEMKISSTNDNNDFEQHQQRLNIPKSPSFHSGLDLLAGSGNKFANKFNFSTDMNGNANKSANAEQQSGQPAFFSLTKV